MATPAYRVGIVSLSNGFAAKTRWRGRVYYGRREGGGLTYRLSGGIAVRPAPRWSLSVDPNYLRHVDHQQYVTELAGGPVATYSRRYVFATVDQSTWLAQIRFNYTIKAGPHGRSLRRALRRERPVLRSRRAAGAAGPGAPNLRHGREHDHA